MEITIILDKTTYLTEFFTKMQKNSILSVRDIARMIPRSTYNRLFLPKIAKLNQCVKEVCDASLFKPEFQQENNRASIVITRNPDMEIIKNDYFIVLRIKDGKEQDG